MDEAVNQSRAVERHLASLQGRIAAQPRAHAVLLAAKALHGAVRKVVAKHRSEEPRRDVLLQPAAR